MTRPQTFKIPEEKRAQAKELSRIASHASVRSKLAQTRFSKAMDEAESDQKALDFFDVMKARSLEFEKAQGDLMEFLKDLDATIESEPERWALSADDETLVYQAPDRSAGFPQLQRGNGR
jgi:hypothetical protein